MNLLLQYSSALIQIAARQRNVGHFDYLFLIFHAGSGYVSGFRNYRKFSISPPISSPEHAFNLNYLVSIVYGLNIVLATTFLGATSPNNVKMVIYIWIKQ